MTAKARGAEHVSMAGNTLLCNRCGARQELTLPQPVDSVAALIKAWDKAHRKCTGDRRAFRDAATVYDWIASDDTGASSKAIWKHMRTGNALPGDRWDVFGASYPLDPSDFGRCYRLLKLAPEWRARLGEMAGYGVVWASLAAAWDELTALYEAELPSGKCPRLYARMKELGT